MLLVGGETYERGVWSNAILPLVLQSTKNGGHWFIRQILRVDVGIVTALVHCVPLNSGTKTECSSFHSS